MSIFRQFCMIFVFGTIITTAITAQAQPPKSPTPVDVTPAILTEFVDKFEALGTAKARESVTLTASTTDKIKDLRFSDGMTVTKGTIIATLDIDEEIAELRAAKANLAEQKRELKRVTNLVKARTFPTARLDEQKTLYEKAQAEVQVAEARIDVRQIVAPFDGVLGLRLVSPGALVVPGTPISTLDDISIIKLDFTVPETVLASLRPGLTVKARASAWPDKVFTGKVTTIDTRINPVSRAVTIRAEIPNPDAALRPGMLMTVELIHNRTLALTIPEQALLADQDKNYIYVLNNDAVQKKFVTIGRRRPGHVEITSGLKADENVVIAGTIRVRDGSPVKPTFISNLMRV